MAVRNTNSEGESSKHVYSGTTVASGQGREHGKILTLTFLPSFRNASMHVKSRTVDQDYVT